MSTIQKIQERLAALEAASSAPPSLAVYTEAMKRASKEEAVAWIRVCQELMDSHPEAFPDREAPAAASAARPKASAAPKDKKTTNSSGPTEWTLKVKEVQRELAELAGVDYASFFDGVAEEDGSTQKKAQDAFNKAAGAAGAGWQIAMKEASIRKKVEEKGLSREDAEAEAAAEAEKKTEKKAARKGSVSGSDSGSVASAPAEDSLSRPHGSRPAAAEESLSRPHGSRPAAAEKPVKAKKSKKGSLAEAAGLEGEAEAEPKAKKEAKAQKPKAKKEKVDLRKQQLEEAGLIEKEIDGQIYIIEPESGEAFLPGEDGEILGERVGVYDADLEIVELDD